MELDLLPLANVLLGSRIHLGMGYSLRQLRPRAEDEPAGPQSRGRKVFSAFGVWSEGKPRWSCRLTGRQAKVAYFSQGPLALWDKRRCAWKWSLRTGSLCVSTGVAGDAGQLWNGTEGPVCQRSAYRRRRLGAPDWLWWKDAVPVEGRIAAAVSNATPVTGSGKSGHCQQRGHREGVLRPWPASPGYGPVCHQAWSRLLRGGCGESMGIITSINGSFPTRC